MAERKQVDGFFTIKQRLIHLMAAARFDDHVAVLFEDNIGIVVEIKDGDGRQLDGSTARLGHSIRIHQVDQGLNDGVIGSIHVSVQRKRAFSVAVKSRVAIRRDNPVLENENNSN
jgi:hypothetical protein